MAKQAQSLIDRLVQKIVDAICSRSLVCDTCRDAPAPERLALAFRPRNRMPASTGAGCFHVGRNSAS